ncbi:hypothetical protein QTP70_034951, partial [Hemibagrus guttatus]
KHLESTGVIQIHLRGRSHERHDSTRLSHKKLWSFWSANTQNGSPDGNTLRLITEEFVNAPCGQTVTLKCSIEQRVEVLEYSWTYGNKVLCEHKNSTSDCRYTENQELLLNIQQVNQNHSGKYICKLMADSGHGSNHICLSVSVCNAESNKAKPLSHACAPESKWIIFLVPFTAVLSLASDPGI